MKKLLILLLAAALCLGTLAACAGTPAEPGETTPDASEPLAAYAEDAPVKSVMVDGTDLAAFHILYSEDDGPSVGNAAAELGKYIKLATGLDLPVTTDASAEGKRIAVTTTEEDAESFTIKSDEGGITISGGRTRGALYGVYNFLEDELGWHFLTVDTEVIDPADAITLDGLDVSYTPYFDFRDIYWSEYFNADISAKRMINSNDHRNFPEELGGGISYADGYFVHTIGTLGELTDTTKQPCFCDEELYQTTLKNVMKVLEEQPDADIISISQLDGGHTEFCRCRDCLKIVREDKCYMGPMLRFINRIADEVAKEYPDVKIHTLAYLDSQQTPKVTVPRDNVIVQVCTINCCFNHPIQTDDYEDNATLMRDLENWCKVCDNVWVWDYTTSFKFYLMPFPNLNVLRDNMRYFADNHVKGLFEEGNYNSVNGEFGELRAYLLARLAQNPYMTDEEYEEEINTFLKGYYGSAWEKIRAYIDFIQACGETRGHFSIYNRYEDVVDPDMIREKSDWLVTLFDEAEALADDDKILNHVQRTRVSCDYIRLTVLYDEMISSEDENVRNSITEQVRNLRSRIDSFGMRVHESYVTSETIDCNPFDW